MSDNSKIEWTEASWNPVTGCTKVSPGCDNCYAETFAERWRGTPGHAYENGFDLQLRPERLDQPLRWHRPRRIFVNSMSDLFHDDVPDLFITQVFDVMEQAQQHTFQVLTKRHARMRSFVRRRETTKQEYAAKFDDCPTEAMRNSPAAEWARRRAANPPSNIWLGVSVENQQWADIRVPALLDTPAAVRWLSCEPLLGVVDLQQIQPSAGARVVDALNGTSWLRGAVGLDPTERIDWVVVGGESGPGARPMHPDWVRSVRDQCTAAGVPFFFKQWGSWAPGKPGGWHSRTQWIGRDGALLTSGEASRPDDAFMYAPKSKSLRELDGRTWDEYPSQTIGANA